MNKLKLLATTGVLCALVAPAFAQDVEEDSDDRIVVTGSRIARPSLEANSPLTTYNAEVFQLDAETNVVRQLLLLPQFQAEQAVNSGNGNTFTGNYLNLRGLGKKRTLVLVNGRRWITTVSNGGVDVATIPPELIERVDIVTGGGAATYGADAIAGVVNFIFKDDFDELIFNAQTGITEKGEHTNVRVSVTGGAAFDDGRGSAYFHAAWDDTKQILANGRPFLDPTVINRDGELVPFNSEDVVAGAAFVDGVRAIFDQNGELFSAPGVINPLTEDDLFNPGRFTRLQLPSDKIMLAGGVDYELSDRVTFDMNGLYVREETTILTSTQGRFLGQFSIPVDHPFVGPITQDYFASLDGDMDGFINLPGFVKRLEGLDRITFVNRDSYYLGGGFDIDLGGGWALETFATYAESEFRPRFFGFPHFERLGQALDVVDGPNGPECRDPTFNGLPCVPLNVFGEGKITPEAADFINAEGGLTGVNTELDVQAIVSGEPFELPAGPVGFAAGFEWRRSTGGEFPNEVWRTGVTGIQIGTFEATLKQTEGFAETIVPLIKDAPFAEYLGLELGSRYTSFSSGSDAWTYKLLGDWSPVDGMRFRGGYQKSTRAPVTFELGGADQFDEPLLFLAGQDPCFTGEPLTGDVRTSCIADGFPVSLADMGAPFPGGPYRRQAFGNPNLDPESAKAYTAGVVLSDLFGQNLSFAADYFNIELQDTIGRTPSRFIFSRCYESGTSGTDPFCDSIDRDPTTGAVTRLNVGFNNLGTVQTSGIDFGLNYSRPMAGVFSPGADLTIRTTANYLIDLSSQAIADGSGEGRSCVGLYGRNCVDPLPEWKASTRISWDEGPVTLAVTWTWFGGVTSDAVVFEPDFAEQLARTEIKGHHYIDLAAVWRVNETVELRGGIKNITSIDPPVVGVNQGTPGFGETNTFPAVYDSIGRRFFIGARLRF